MINSFIVYKLINFYFYTLDYNNFTLLTILPEIFLFLLFFISFFFITFNYPMLYLYSFSIVFILFIIVFYAVLLFNYQFFFYEHFFFINFGFFDFYSLTCKAFILLLSLIILIITKNSIYNLKNKFLNEFLLLFLFSLFFIVILFSVTDFFSTFLALEGMSFSLYILASTIYYNQLCLESSIKYFILGGIASCILLYGISLLFIVTNSLDFFIIKYYLLNNINFNIRLDIISIIICFIISFFFKLSIFPCHM